MRAHPPARRFETGRADIIYSTNSPELSTLYVRALCESKPRCANTQHRGAVLQHGVRLVCLVSCRMALGCECGIVSRGVGGG